MLGVLSKGAARLLDLRAEEWIYSPEGGEEAIVSFHVPLTPFASPNLIMALIVYRHKYYERSDPS
jgi:hypothetical protein